MIALRYGTPPVVHRTGGLADTVIDEYLNPGRGTGFVFEHPTADGLVWACEQAIAARADAAGWAGLLDRGMAVDNDWASGPTAAYLDAARPGGGRWRRPLGRAGVARHAARQERPEAPTPRRSI